MSPKQTLFAAPLALAIFIGASTTQAGADSAVGQSDTLVTPSARAPLASAARDGRPYVLSVVDTRGFSPTQTVTMALAVDHSDLDLRKAEDVKQLNTRVRLAARSVCTDISHPVPAGYYVITNTGECFERALADARGQVDKIISRAQERRELASAETPPGLRQSR